MKDQGGSDKDKIRKPKSNKNEVSFYLPPDLFMAFKHFAVDKHKTHSELAEEAIKALLQANGKWPIEK